MTSVYCEVCFVSIFRWSLVVMNLSRLFSPTLVLVFMFGTGAILTVKTVSGQAALSSTDTLQAAVPEGFVIALEGDSRVCRQASRTEARAMEGRDPAALLHAITHHDDALTAQAEQTQGNGLKIILRGTAQLENYPTAKAAFIRAAAQWESLIKSPITIVIDVDYGPTRFGTPWEPNILGSTRNQSIGGSSLYPTTRANLLAKASSTAEQTLYQALPMANVPTDIGETKGVLAASAVFRALGIIAAVADPDAERANYGDPPSIGFNSNQSFDFDPSDGISSGKQDFESTATHELGHALGFSTQVGVLELYPDNTLYVSTLDLFRFRPDMALGQVSYANRILSSGGSQIFFNGDEELPFSTGRPDMTGGDGRQAAHWKDDELIGTYIGIMDPTGKNGQLTPLTENDVTAIDTLGYELYTGVATLTGGVAQHGFLQAPSNRTHGTLALQQYRIDIPGDAVQLQVGLTGDLDVDLYVRYGGPITLYSNGSTNADFYAESPEDAELINIPTPTLRAGTYYIAIGNFSTYSSYYAVAATIVKNDTVTLRSGIAQTGLLSAPSWAKGFVAGQTQYQIQVPMGANRLEVTLTGNQDVDLFVRYGQRVTFYPNSDSDADYVSESPGGSESLTITNASSPPLRQGTYFIAVGNYGPGAVSFTLTATINGTVVSVPVTSVSAASYGSVVASESIAAGFGDRLAVTTASATTLPLPTTLGGTTVRVKDSAGVERLAPLFFVSVQQVNYLVPSGVANGVANVMVTSGDGTVSTGTAQIGTVAPAFFSADGSGQGLAAGMCWRVRSDQSQSIEPIVRWDAAQGRMVPIPIELGPAGEQVYLVLFGTGIRGRNSAFTATVGIGGMPVAADYAGSQGSLAGLDQVNVLVPRSLSGRGEVEIVMTVDARITNTVRVGIR
jgi:uncharacterized protein (TIGR03437 family)